MLHNLPKLILKLFKNKKMYLVFIIGIICVLLIIVFSIGRSFENNEIWLAVQRGDFIIDLFESGEIRAVKAEFVRAPQEWMVDLQIIDLVPDGTIVNEGDILVQFNTSGLDEELGTLYDNMKQAEADLNSIDSQQENHLFELETALQIAQFTLETAQLQTELIKYESKIKQDEASLNLETAKLRYEEAKKKIDTQKIIDNTARMKVAVKLDQAQAMVEQIKSRINNLTLRAPITGMVVYNEIIGNSPNGIRYKPSVGDKVRSGSAVISIPDLSKMKMVVKLNELDAGKLSVGNKAFILLDAFEDKEYHGTVSDISSIVSKGERSYLPVAKAPSVEVSILIEEDDEMLKPGMTAQARIVLEEIPDVISVPVGAIYEDDNGSTIIWTRKSYPEPLHVELGKRNDYYFIVKDNFPEGTEISWTPPSESSHPLGWFAEMKRRRTEFQEYLDQIETMTELGITNDLSPSDSTKIEYSPDGGPDIDASPGSTPAKSALQGEE